MILTRASYEVLLEEISKWDGNYLEIGIWEGEMLKDFALRWPEKMFYGIDPFLSDEHTTGHCSVPIGERIEHNAQCAYENFKDVPNIKFFEQTSESFSQCTDETLEAMNLSVVYIDGSHTYHDTLVDLDLARRAMKHGLIYIDDHTLQTVLQATNHFVSVNRYRIEKHEDHIIILRP